MGKFKAFDIVFDHPQAVYHAGETLQGHIMVDLSEPMKMRSIRILFHGQANVHWDKMSSYENVHYGAQERYFQKLLTLLGRADGNATTLQAGISRYPFRLQLNSNLPSSFEGQYGYVRYLGKATIDKPWKFNYVCKAAFTVIGEVDLNLEQENMLSPTQDSQSKEVNCFCCDPGNVEATFRINRTGFVPGESILVNVEVLNKSDADVTASSVSLKQHVTYYGKSHSIVASRDFESKCVSAVIRTITRIAPEPTECWDNVPLLIPPLPPSRLAGCNIIHISYVVTFYVSLTYGSDIKFAKDVIIGTIPLRSAYAPHIRSGVITQQPTAPPLDDRPSEIPPEVLQESGPPSYEDYIRGLVNIGDGEDSQYTHGAGPPSYEECIRGSVNIADAEDSQYTRGKLNWTPVYPTYHLPSASPGEFASNQI